MTHKAYLPEYISDPGFLAGKWKASKVVQEVLKDLKTCSLNAWGAFLLWKSIEKGALFGCKLFFILVLKIARNS